MLGASPPASVAAAAAFSKSRRRIIDIKCTGSPLSLVRTSAADLAWEQNGEGGTPRGMERHPSSCLGQRRHLRRGDYNSRRLWHNPDTRPSSAASAVIILSRARSGLSRARSGLITFEVQF